MRSDISGPTFQPSVLGSVGIIAGFLLVLVAMLVTIGSM